MKCIEIFKDEFEVILEVGKKDQNLSELMSPEVWINQINEALTAEVDYVVLEGRESSSSGIFRPNGELRKGLLIEIKAHCNIEKLIFEVPCTKDQVDILELYGEPVGFGNISICEVIKLKALIFGLRGDTIGYAKVKW